MDQRETPARLRTYAHGTENAFRQIMQVWKEKESGEEDDGRANQTGHLRVATEVGIHLRPEEL